MHPLSCTRPVFRIAALSVLVACGTRSPPELSPELTRALGHPQLGVVAGARTTGARLTFDRGAEQFVFGERAAGVSPGTQTFGPAGYEARFGGRTGSLYIKRHDAQAGLTLTPAASPLKLEAALERSDTVVYASTSGDSAVVLAPRPEGVKEDIVLTRPAGDRLLFEWKLGLEQGLEARLDAEGNVNVYGPSQYLWGDVQISDEKSRKLIETARRTAARDQLLYRIPAPVIRTAAGAAPGENARFVLEGSRLALVASGLAGLAYPISIDPTVLVTLTQEFALGGNNEGGVQISNDRVRRAKTSKGVGSWAITSSVPTARRGHSTVAYDGRLYVIGGLAAAAVNDVQVAPINSNGTLGTWTATTSFPTARFAHASVAYNGYLYVIGGYTGGTYLNSVLMAPIGPGGALGSWASTTAFPTARFAHTAVAHHGYLYVMGGSSSGSRLSDVQVAPINADGTVGAWTATTAFTTARYYHSSVAYNGYLYIIGGMDAGYRSDVQVAPINPDGTVGPWTLTIALPAARGYHFSVASDGYLYVLGGSGGSGLYLNEVLIAALNANGTVGGWTGTTPFPSARLAFGTAYNGHLYVVGGYNGTNLNDVQVAPMNANGAVGSWANGNALPTTRWQHTTVAYDGYLYVLGGRNAANLNDVQVARLNANGTMGAWAATTSFPTARYGHTSVAYNGHLYVIGGSSAGNLSDVQVAPINPNGTLGAWTATTSIPTARTTHSSVAHNGYLYVIGGSTVSARSDVQVAPINADGTLGAWTATTSVGTARYGHSSVVSRGYLYVIGGTNVASLSSVEMAALNPDGTVGAWSATAALPTARTGHTTVSHGGYLYLAGGFDTAYLNEVLVAPVNANGTLGAWSASTGFPTPRGGHGSVVHDGFLYVTGGSNGAPLSAVQRAPLDRNGTLGAWTATSPFNSARHSHASVAHNGFLYVLGGYNAGVYYGDVQVAPMNANGTLGPWTSTSAFPTPRQSHGGVVANGYLYVTGGYNGAYLADVQFAPINADGTVGSWAATTGFPTARAYHATAASGGYLYVIGGYSGASLSDVQFAPLNANGTVGAWTATSAIPTARFNHSSLSYNGKLYVIGGSSGTAGLDDVQVAALNANGTVGAWSATTPLPAARQSHSSLAASGYLYVIGGYGPAYRGDVQVAPIFASGAVGNWTGTTGFPTARDRHTSAIHNGFLYVLGGSTGASYLNEVQVAPIELPPARGIYSKLVDLAAAATSLDSLTVNGLAANRGRVSVQYRVAPAAGVFGPTVDKGVIPLGTAIPLGDASVRYVWLRFLLDDSESAVIDVAVTNERDVTDFSLTYTGTPCTGVICTALDQCHLPGTCDPGTGLCSNPLRPDGSSCADGSACTQTDTCQGGVCTGANPVVCVALDQCHDAGVCAPATGLCSNPARTDGSACTDGTLCTQTDTCQAGACTGANPVVCAALDQCHDVGVCAPATGLCSNPAKADGSACSDGTPCTQTDSCQAGACTGANPVVCAALDQCHDVGVCAPATGLCSNPAKADGSACSDGSLCTQTDSCQAGACTGTNPVVCAALDQCHDVGVCAPATGVCSNPAKADGSSCTDGTACTSGETCQAGACGSPVSTVTCAALDQCHDVGTCAPSTGLCSNPSKADGTACTDANACTTGEACQAGACSGGAALTCAALDQCHDVGVCNPLTGCSNPSKADGTACTDDDACTTGETCQTGACGSPVSTVACNALDQCHEVGACDQSTGTCSNPLKANGSACDDARACTSGDNCQAGTCSPAANNCPCSSNADCAPLDQCHLAGTCELPTGICSNPQKPAGSACNDADGCTIGETCGAGTCGSPTSTVTCSALDGCHEVGVCDSSTGVCSQPSKADGASCAGGSCAAGACVAASDAGEIPQADAGPGDGEVVPAGCGCAAGSFGGTFEALLLLGAGLGLLRRRGRT